MRSLTTPMSLGFVLWRLVLPSSLTLIRLPSLRCLRCLSTLWTIARKLQRIPVPFLNTFLQVSSGGHLVLITASLCMGTTLGTSMSLSIGIRVMSVALQAGLGGGSHQTYT
uniref:Exonuclease n=1 Tax=uncultured marine virus TaxID=186617 RepID=A0A0F7L892_9VIRU|nr:exonuclease [uncultured marine virus]